ncbi:MAG: hypothetical protein AAF466_13300 [Bacteroidota bacterium]
MSSYTVGTNKPIKLKVSISTVGHATTAHYLNDPDNEGQFLVAPSSSPISNTDSTSFRQINNGEAVQGRTIRVRTILTFPSGIDDENTFNRAVQQAKNTYSVQLSGGTPSPESFDFEVKSIFSIVKVAEFTSEITFI